MLKDKLPAERLALIGLLALVVGLAAYVLARAAHQPAPIVFQPVAAAATNSDPAKPQQPSEVVVHTVGAVNHAGVLHLPSDSRVDDAVRAAGGAAPDADLESINLAAKLVDGSQVCVPHKGKTDEVAAVAEPYKGGIVTDAYAAHPRESKAGRGGSKKEPSAPVSLNTGSIGQLESLPGVGPSTAQKILDYRMQHGGFTSVDELMAVKGIGPKKMKAMRKFLRL